jgi:hypothetical protein
MYTRHYAPWEHYPKSLALHEIQNPMKVITEFFDLDKPEGHLKVLKEWRECVTSEKVYNHNRRGPAALVHDYEITIKLLEAAFILLVSRKNNVFAVVAPPEQLNEEKSRWDYYPTVLNVDEQRDPYLAIEEIFEERPLELYRDFLFEWLFTALSTQPADPDLTAAEVITVYENLIKLYEATWVIYQRHEDMVKARANMNVEVTTEDTINANATNAPVKEPTKINVDDLKIDLYALDNALVEDKQEVLSNITDKIKHKVPLTEVVFYLGIPSSEEQSIFILVVVSSMEKRRACEIIETIENTCKPFADVIALVAEQSVVERRLNEENSFYKQAMACPVIYFSGRLFIPTGNTNSVIKNLNTSGDNWARWYGQADNFFDGAEYFIQSGAYRSALFLLHQAIESALMAIIIAVTGYRPNSHNLSRLISLTKIFTPCIGVAFERYSPNADKTGGYVATEEQGDVDNGLFKLLSDAYVGVRYRDNFEVDDEQIIVIYNMVKNVLTVIPKIYTKHIATTSL